MGHFFCFTPGLCMRAWRNGRRARFRIWCRKAYEFESLRPHYFKLAVVAQLVERHLAKVEVASPSLVYRSKSSVRV